jgi:prolyl-tRNA synthetase
MLYSQLFTKTTKDISSDETSKNAQLLIRAGFIHKTMAGVYSYLPLGLRVLNNIENIVRENMNSIGGQEILMNALHPKKWWETTNRWDGVDILFKLKSQTNSEYALACSHEEQVTPIAQQYIKSWKDLPHYDPENSKYPLSVYQIQTKFRDELRSKSGIMRGREFRMKDMYDFHATKESQDAYYELVKETYLRIFDELGLKVFAVHASGGIFTQNDSHEFQVLTDAGEDEIYYNIETGFAINNEVLEIMKEEKQEIPPNLVKGISAEVGNIFKLDDKYTKAFGVTYAGLDNTKMTPLMNCHGLGTTRTMGVIAEIYSDEKGLKWPESVAPFMFQMITAINQKDDEQTNEKILELAQQIYGGECESEELFSANSETVLWDDRNSAGFGEKMSDAELIGCPWLIVISKRSLESGGVELKNRASGEVRVVEV